MHKTRWWCCTGAGVLVWVSGEAVLAAAGPAMRGVVPANWPADTPAPVVVPAPSQLKADQPLEVLLQIEGTSEPKRLAAQYEPADAPSGMPARVWFMWSGQTGDRGKAVTLRFEPGPRGPRPSAYRSRQADPQLQVATAEGQPVLSYWYGQPERGQKYPLNDFIHPVVGLDGEILTVVRPADEIHQRGLFWAWVRHERKGQPIGEWWVPMNIHAEPGEVGFTDGPLFARFAARHWWVHQPPETGQGERFVDEYVVCRTFQTAAHGRAIDIDLTLTALDDGVRIGGQTAKDKGYGGLAMRFGKAAQVKIEADTREVQMPDMNHLRARWVDWTGVFDGPGGKPLTRRSGTAIFGPPPPPPPPTPTG